MSWPVRLPDDWATERGSGWWELHHLVHTRCSWRSGHAYDFASDGQIIRSIVYGHECEN